MPGPGQTPEYIRLGYKRKCEGRRFEENFPAAVREKLQRGLGGRFPVRPRDENAIGVELARERADFLPLLHAEQLSFFRRCCGGAQSGTTDHRYA
jgi:hypothetical protein